MASGATVADRRCASTRGSSSMVHDQAAQRYAGRNASEISSRSSRLRARRDRRRGAGRMPPCGLRSWKIAPDDRSNTRPISFSPSPHLVLGKVLRRSPEATTQSYH